MAKRMEMCNGCGGLLLLPLEARTVKCALCLTITRLRRHEPQGRANDSPNNAALSSYMNPSAGQVNGRTRPRVQANDSPSNAALSSCDPSSGQVNGRTRPRVQANDSPSNAALSSCNASSGQVNGHTWPRVQGNGSPSNINQSVGQVNGHTSPWVQANDSPSSAALSSYNSGSGQMNGHTHPWVQANDSPSNVNPSAGQVNGHTRPWGQANNSPSNAALSSYNSSSGQMNGRTRPRVQANDKPSNINPSAGQVNSHTRPWLQANDSPSNAGLSSYVNGSAGQVNSRTRPGDFGNCPSQYSQPPRPLTTTASAHGKKRAVLCGVSYYGKRHSLKGSINDVRQMKCFLVEKMRFPNESVVILTEEEKNPTRIPTKKNIRSALRWLVQGVQPGDSLVFHFSGHGTRQRDYDNDEIDGQDEAVCPLDHDTEGQIIDDEINATIVRPLPTGAKLHAIIDACYSATVLDLPYLCRMSSEGYYTWEDQSSGTTYKGTSGGLAICFSACDDDQTSDDTSAFSKNGMMTGATTYTFINAVQNDPGSTYGCLLNSMRCAIRQAKAGIRLKGPIASILNQLLLNSNVSQEPQISSSATFNLYKTKFVL